MEILATGQITITDLNDGAIIIGKVNTKSPTSVLYDPGANAYEPNWSNLGEELDLTAEFNRAGFDENLLDGNLGTVTEGLWTIRTNNLPSVPLTGSSPGYVVSTENNGKNLVYKLNPFTESIFIVTFEYTGKYLDPNTLLTIPLSTSISFTKVTNGAGQYYLLLRSEDGTSFKNGAGSNGLSYLRLQAELYFGIQVIPPSAADNVIEYKWFKRNPYIAHKLLSAPASAGDSTIYLKNQTTGLSDVDEMEIGDFILVGSGENVEPTTYMIISREATGVSRSVTISGALTLDHPEGSLVAHDGYSLVAGDGWQLISYKPNSFAGWSEVGGIRDKDEDPTTIDDWLCIYNSEVLNVGTFRCFARCQKTGYLWISNEITITDMWDPLQVQIWSTGGNYIKNGSGSSLLLAQLFSGSGGEIGALNGIRSSAEPAHVEGTVWHCTNALTPEYYNRVMVWNEAGQSWDDVLTPYNHGSLEPIEFIWTMTDKDGVDKHFVSDPIPLSTDWEDKAGRQGKSIIITQDDISIKSTIRVDVRKVFSL